jgi:GAF domain-containing protein
LLYKQIASLVESESDTIANMANVAAMIHTTFGFWWTGFYRVVGEELVLGPFQGPLACSRIKYGRGVCGTTWKEQTTQVVPDVELFPGHIACSSLARSEIVVPVWQGKEIVAVLDIDSENLATFDDVDKKWLEKIVALL